MIWLDTTKLGKSGHHSGLMRVTSRLSKELGDDATEIRGTDWIERAEKGDWFLTAEVFSPDEREGWADMLESRPCRLAAIYHDAIPMKFPRTTWPKSVARHPTYLKMLARFDLVWAVSESSRSELLGYWSWLGLRAVPLVKVIALGADFDGQSRSKSTAPSAEKVLLNVAILEPRKNQGQLLDACEVLWSEGLEFELHLVGRVNPHFGRVIEKRIKQAAKTQSRLHFHAAASDEKVAELFAKTRATVFPTRAEGCGLPIIESLWRGLPCVCSDLPVLRENADGGGCVAVPLDYLPAWVAALRKILTDDAHYARLTNEAQNRPLVTWRETANTIRSELIS